MRVGILILMLLTGCETTRREDEHFERLFDERALEGSQFEPYQPHDEELWRIGAPRPAQSSAEIMRYFVPADDQGFTPGDQTGPTWSEP